MAQRKSFLLRLDPVTHEVLQRWADAEMRSLNGQIEFLLRKALRQAGLLPNAEMTARDQGDVNHPEVAGE